MVDHEKTWLTVKNPGDHGRPWSSFRLGVHFDHKIFSDKGSCTIAVNSTFCKPNNKTFALTKLGAFADNKFNVAKIKISGFDKVENIVGKGENASY